MSSNFLKDWSAHGQPLRASFKLEHNQFLVLTVDEDAAKASGCSIDASVHLIQALERELNVSLTNNGNVAFMIEDEVSVFPFNTIKAKVEKAEISPDTKIFDNTIQSLSDFNSKWLIDSEKSWVKRFF